MFAKIASLLFALFALTGAILYAQKKAKENPQIRPVFETSKSGTPTPIEEVPAEKNDKTNAENAEAVKQQNKDQAPPQKKKKKAVMPTSKSYFPD